MDPVRVGKKNFLKIISLWGDWDSGFSDQQKIEIIGISIKQTGHTYVPIYLFEKWQDEIQLSLSVIEDWFESARPKIQYWLIRKFQAIYDVDDLRVPPSLLPVYLKMLLAKNMPSFPPIINNTLKNEVTDEHYESLFEIYCLIRDPNIVLSMSPTSGENWRPRNFDYRRLQVFFSLGFQLREDELAPLTIDALQKDDHIMASCLLGRTTNSKEYWNNVIFGLLGEQNTISDNILLWIVFEAWNYLPLLILTQNLIFIREIFYPKIFLWLQSSPGAEQFSAIFGIHSKYQNLLLTAKNTLNWNTFSERFITRRYVSRAVNLARNSPFTFSDLPPMQTFSDGIPYRISLDTALDPEYMNFFQFLSQRIAQQLRNSTYFEKIMKRTDSPLKKLQNGGITPMIQREIVEHDVREESKQISDLREDPITHDQLTNEYFMCTNPHPHFFSAEEYVAYAKYTSNASICPVDKTHPMNPQRYFQKQTW